jgi:hypothetical protein
MIMELGSRRVWSINRGCLLLLGTWSHIRYIRGSALAHLFFWLVFPTWILRLITRWYRSHFIQSVTLDHVTWLPSVAFRRRTFSLSHIEFNLREMELNWFIIYLFLWIYLRINSLWTALTALRSGVVDQIILRTVNLYLFCLCKSLLMRCVVPAEN